MQRIAQVIEELTGAYSELKRYLGWRLRDTHHAADIAQESFERAYTHALKGKVASPRALLFSTARNLLIDQGRRDQSSQVAMQELGVQGQDDTEASAECHARHRQQLDRVMARLSRLPRKRRDAFVLARIYGYSHAEIAARMNITVAAVEKHIARASLDCADLNDRADAVQSSPHE